MNRVFLVDLIKFICVFGMFIRHTTFYFYDGFKYEYSVESFNIFSFFIPVTGSFVFILGYSFALSYKNKIKSKKIDYDKYLKMFIYLLFFAVFVSIVTYFRDFTNYTIENYLVYFLFNIWNVPPKPGFYILVPLSFIFFMYYLILKRYFKTSFVLFITILSLLSLNDYYVLHYLIFGIIGFFIGVYFDVQKTLDFLKNKFIILCSIIFFIFIFNFDIKLNLISEFIMLISFIILFNLSIPIFKLKYLEKYISFTSSKIFLFYIIHVLGLNLFARFIDLRVDYIGIFILSFVYFSIVYILLKVYERINIGIR